MSHKHRPKRKRPIIGHDFGFRLFMPVSWKTGRCWRSIVRIVLPDLNDKSIENCRADCRQLLVSPTITRPSKRTIYRHFMTPFLLGFCIDSNWETSRSLGIVCHCFDTHPKSAISINDTEPQMSDSMLNFRLEFTKMSLASCVLGLIWHW